MKTLASSDLIFKDGSYWEIDTNKRFTGTVENFYPNGQLYFIETYKNGLQNN